MQASLLSSDHGSHLCKSKGILCSQRLPFKPDSPRHLKYDYIFTALSATLDANIISPMTTLTSRCRSNNVPPLLCGNSSNSLDAHDGSGRSFRGWVEVVGVAISTAFPLWVALGCYLGILRPDSLFNWFQSKWTKMVIAFTMLGIGTTLTFDDLKGALAMPKELFAGFFLQTSVMPLSAYYIGKYLNLPSYYAAGLVLAGCCPGGTASSIVTYIARGNVALSLFMTAASTVSVVVMTPVFTMMLAGNYVAVDAIGLLKSTLQVMLLPVLMGAFLNHYFKRAIKFVSPLIPPVAGATIGLLCGHAFGQSSLFILFSGEKVFLAAVLLHTSGFFFGYLLSRILGISVSSSRTISIHVGMQNTMLGVILAIKHSSCLLAALPCAASNVCHLTLGSTSAGLWRRITPETLQVTRDT